jgi:hypothetical protein
MLIQNLSLTPRVHTANAVKHRDDRLVQREHQYFFVAHSRCPAVPVVAPKRIPVNRRIRLGRIRRAIGAVMMRS